MEGPSTTTPIEGSEEAWSTIATEGGGILAEYVEEGLLQVHRAGAHDDAAYLCTLCSRWNNGHEKNMPGTAPAAPAGLVRDLEALGWGVHPGASVESKIIVSLRLGSTHWICIIGSALGSALGSAS